jgi:hypothetical protein
MAPDHHIRLRIVALSRFGLSAECEIVVIRRRRTFSVAIEALRSGIENDTAKGCEMSAPGPIADIQRCALSGCADMPNL